MGAVDVLKIHPGVKPCEVKTVCPSAEGGLSERCVYRLGLFSNLSNLTFCLSISPCSKREIIEKKK